MRRKRSAFVVDVELISLMLITCSVGVKPDFCVELPKIVLIAPLERVLISTSQLGREESMRAKFESYFKLGFQFFIYIS